MAEKIDIRFSAAGACIIGGRENQQDSHVVCQNAGKIMAVVSDGMGGLTNGAEISGIVTYVCREEFDWLIHQKSKEMGLMQVIGSANKQACEFITQNGGALSGATLVAVYLEENDMRFISVGDSRIYLMRSNSLLQINREHIYAYELDRQVANGELSPGEAALNRERKSLISYMGMGKLAYVDRNLEPVKLQKGDKILLASDGVFKTLSDGEMMEELSADTPQRAADGLMQVIEAKNKARQDNATAVVVFCE